MLYHRGQGRVRLVFLQFHYVVYVQVLSYERGFLPRFTENCILLESMLLSSFNDHLLKQEWIELINIISFSNFSEFKIDPILGLFGVQWR